MHGRLYCCRVKHSEAACGVVSTPLPAAPSLAGRPFHVHLSSHPRRSHCHGHPGGRRVANAVAGAPDACWCRPARAAMCLAVLLGLPTGCLSCCLCQACCLSCCLCQRLLPAISPAPRLASLLTLGLQGELQHMADAMAARRHALHDALVRVSAPGCWDHIAAQRGMFSFTGLTRVSRHRQPVLSETLSCLSQQPRCVCAC